MKMTDLLDGPMARRAIVKQVFAKLELKIGGHEVRLDHMQRVPGAVEYGETNIKDCILGLKNNPHGEYARMSVQALENLHAFLATFPCLIESKACEPGQLLGKRPSYAATNQFPGQDHTFYWRVKGCRGPILCTTFPYGLAAGNAGVASKRAEMVSYADKHGFSVEFAPQDVPDIWYPGSTTPVAWSKKGVDWRRRAQGTGEPQPTGSGGVVSYSLT
jgi:hypothetical protein